MLRMNLNTFDRQCVFAIPGMAEMIEARLKDEAEIRKSRVFPYQLMTAYMAASNDVPVIVREALQDALEIAISNVPAIASPIFFFTVPARNPRTLCCCHSVACIMSSMLAPSGRLKSCRSCAFRGSSA